MPQKKLKITMKVFVSPQVTYCPLIWMFHSRQINYKINKRHERALKIFYKDQISSFEELFSKTNLSQKSIKEIFSLSPHITQDIFETKSNYCNTSKTLVFSSKNIKTTRYELQTISLMAPKI